MFWTVGANGRIKEVVLHVLRVTEIAFHIPDSLRTSKYSMKKAVGPLAMLKNQSFNAVKKN